MSQPASFGTQLMEVAKKIASAEDAGVASKAAVDKKEAEMNSLADELKTLTDAKGVSDEAYKAAIGELKDLADAEDARVNPPTPGA